MLAAGNRKLGPRRIWSFGLPATRPGLCPGLSSLCRRHCYARALERLRPSVRQRYQTNLHLSRRRDFVRRVGHFLRSQKVAVVRLHVSGDFYSAPYAKKWFRVVNSFPRVLFYFYTRSWRNPSLRAILERLAHLPNCRAWYSCDRETGLPRRVPPRVWLAWMLTRPDEVPPAAVNLAFRIPSLRGQPSTRLNGVRICPAEDGVARRLPVTCDRCSLCWRPLPADPAQQESCS